MPLTPDLARQVVAACRQNADQIAAALTQALGLPLEIDATRIEAFPYQDAPPEWNGPGLVVVLQVGSEAILALLAASGGLLPEDLQGSPAHDHVRLAALTSELSKCLLPAEVAVVSGQARYVEHLGRVAMQSGVAAGAGAVHCLLNSGDKTASMRLVWPATSPEAVFGENIAGSPAAEGDAGLPRKLPLSEEEIGDRLRNLPGYARSLLRISVPVSVHLASIKQPVSRVLNIGPGTIIQFEKNCEQPLTLCIGSQPLAEGEAVKVGEKFGIKLTQMILPGERFFSLSGKQGIRKGTGKCDPD